MALTRTTDPNRHTRRSPNRKRSTSGWQATCFPSQPLYVPNLYLTSRTPACIVLRDHKTGLVLFRPTPQLSNVAYIFWATGRLMSPDRRFGTSCLLRCGRLTVSANSEDSRKRFCLSTTRLRRLVTLAFKRRIQILLLTYLLTYLPRDGQAELNWVVGSRRDGLSLWMTGGV